MSHDHFVKKLFALDDMKEYLKKQGHQVELNMDLDQPFYRDLGNEFKDEIDTILRKRRFGRKYVEELDELLELNKDVIENAGKNLDVEIEASRLPIKRKIKSPVKIKSTGSAGKILRKGLTGAGVALTAVSTFLTAEKVMAQSEKFDRAYISGPNGVQALFEKGRFAGGAFVQNSRRLQ